MLPLGEETAVQTVVGSIVWIFRRLKKPRCREMSARGYALRSVCPQLSFFPFPTKLAGPLAFTQSVQRLIPHWPSDLISAYRPFDEMNNFLYFFALSSVRCTAHPRYPKSAFIAQNPAVPTRHAVTKTVYRLPRRNNLQVFIFSPSSVYDQNSQLENPLTSSHFH